MAWGPSSIASRPAGTGRGRRISVKSYGMRTSERISSSRRQGACATRSLELETNERGFCHSPLRSGILGDIDLRALQLAAVIHVDRLPLGEGVQARLARFAVAVAGAAGAAEGGLD